MYSQSRPAVFGATFAVVTAFVASVAVTHQALVRWRLASAEIAIGISFAVVQTAYVLLLLLAAGTSKILTQRRLRSAAAAGPLVRERLASLASADGTPAQGKDLYSAHPAVFEPAVLELLRITGGASRDRVAAVAAAAGLVDEWRRRSQSRFTDRRVRALECLALLRDPADAPVFRAALQGRDRGVRLQALRSLVALDDPAGVELACEAALREPLLTRVLLSRDLQKHSLILAQRVLPRAVRDNAMESIVAALDLISAWNRALPLDYLPPLCRHAGPRVRVAALRALACVQPSPAAAAELLRALSEGDPEERCAAAASAAAQNLAEAAPLLLDNVRHAPFSAKLAAASALCRLGEASRNTLERELGLLDQEAMTAALEAIDAFRTGRATRVGQL